MAFDLVKFERGQVWMIRFKNHESVGREQAKDRPWLVLSVGKFNHSAGMITCVPITTRDSIHTPAQVLFTNHRGIKNVILCEQIRSFDYASGEYSMEFMGNLSNKVLESVDVALSIHLGLHYSPISLQNLYESMESVVKSIISLQDTSPKFSDSDVLNFANKLREVTQSVIEDSISNTTPISNDNSIESSPSSPVVEDNPCDSVSNPAEAPIQREKSPRNNWTKKNCEEFLKDVDNLPMKEVMTKWNIPKKTRVYSTKHYVQGLLNKQKV